MKRFQYARPHTVAEAVALLEEHGDESIPLAPLHTIFRAPGGSERITVDHVLEATKAASSARRRGLAGPMPSISSILYPIVMPLLAVAGVDGTD